VCGGIALAWYGIKFVLYALGTLFLLSVIARGKKR